MSYFTLEAVPARYGDCLLLHYGANEDPRLILIDGGPSQVWVPFLKPRLEKIRQKHGQSFEIDLLMVSHIDDDHVLGITDFTKEWVPVHTSGGKWPYPVRQFWHNSFERVSNEENVGAVTASVTASVGANFLTEVDREEEDDDPEAEQRRAARHVLASVANGKKLRDDIVTLGKKTFTNVGFGGLVRPGVAGKVPVKFGPDLTFHIAGPLPKQLEALQKKFAQDLPKGDEAALAAFSDTSVPNLSSIVVLARFGGKSMLLTGDARGDYVLEGLKQEKLLDADGKLHVDILKLPHHGSDRNVDPSFFEKITADHYVASADGTFINPDRPTLEMIIDARGKDAKFTIHLTYPVADIDKQRHKEWDAGQASDVKKRDKRIADGKKPTAVREDWDEAKHGLGTLFAAREDAGFAFKVSAPASAGPGARIDLLDPVDF
jgi:hypothetical protein